MLELIERIQISPKAKNPNMPTWKANHYKVTLFGVNGKQMTCYYSKGYGLEGEPTISEVLEALVAESTYAYMGLTEFMTMSDIVDVPLARNVLKRVARNTEGLQRITGLDLATLEAWYEEVNQ